MEEDGFTLVKNKRGKRKTQLKVCPREETFPELSEEEIQTTIKKVKTAQESFETSEFFSDFLKTLANVIEKVQVESVICLGIGHFAQSSNLCSQLASQFQLILLLTWIKHLDLSSNYQVLVYDPILTPSEKEILRRLKIQTSEENKEGLYRGSKENLTVFYLPHCPKQLVNNILWKNWDILDFIVILGNSISEIVTRSSEKQLEAITFIKEGARICQEFPLKNNFQRQDIFNNLSFHKFNKPLITLKSPNQPKYNSEDLEFIQNGNKQ